MSYLSAIPSTPSLETIESVTIRPARPDPRLMALLAKPTLLTVEEWAYLEAAEQSAE